MVTQLETTLYRRAVIKLLQKYRHFLYAESGFKKFPSDKELAQCLGISNTAMSSILRGCSSLSGITLRTLFIDLSHISSDVEFSQIVSGFLLD